MLFLICLSSSLDFPLYYSAHLNLELFCMGTTSLSMNNGCGKFLKGVQSGHSVAQPTLGFKLLTSNPN